MKKKVGIILAVILLVIAAAFLLIDKMNKPEVVVGGKTLGITVDAGDGSPREYTVQTQEEFLGAALVAEGLIVGEEGPYGIYVTTVDGVTADEEARQWWRFDKDGVMLNEGIDSVAIADGEHYEIVLDTY